MKRLRLLKVIVQPVFVVDNGESLEEQAAQPVTVSPALWPTFATTEFLAGMEQLRQQVEGDDAGSTMIALPMQEKPPPRLHVER